MKITFDELLRRERGEWLLEEIMNSLPKEVIDSAMEAREYDVKLVVNGFDVEPVILHDMITNVAEYIEKQARHNVSEILEEAEGEAYDLLHTVQEAAQDIKARFKLYEDED